MNVYVCYSMLKPSFCYDDEKFLIKVVKSLKKAKEWEDEEPKNEHIRHCYEKVPME